MLSVYILFIGIGVVIMDAQKNHIKSMDTFVGQKLVGEAVINRDIEQKEWYSQVTARYVDQDYSVMIKDEKYPLVSRGDHIILTCTLALPEPSVEFDYHMYLVMHDIYFMCEDYSYEINGKMDRVSKKISEFRYGVEHIVDQIIPAPESALANGLLFGGGNRLSEKIQDQFALVGMTHIVAVSGYNVSVIVAAVMGFVLFVGFRRKYAVYIAIGSIVFFIALIGFPSSGVRAGIMGIMVLIAGVYGRVTHAYGALVFAGAIMLVYNPLILRYDIGFQLSFLATLGIISTYPILERYFVSKRFAFGIIEMILLTLSAQIFVIPIIALHFYTFTPISLVVNILVLPIIPFVMLLVLLLIIFYYIYAPIALICGWMAYYLLAYEIAVISFFAQLSWSSIHIETIYPVGIVLYYCIVSIFLIRLHKNL